tara:strand:+ start:142 stop:357 length:216 start_codon:yes stop_codon:yes gene_type:complete
MKILDLHGFSHAQAIEACHLFINTNWGHEMKIITGRSDKMKDIVYKVLQGYDVDYTFDNPWFYGYVIIRAH